MTALTTSTATGIALPLPPEITMEPIAAAYYLRRSPMLALEVRMEGDWRLRLTPHRILDPTLGRYDLQIQGLRPDSRQAVTRRYPVGDGPIPDRDASEFLTRRILRAVEVGAKTEEGLHCARMRFVGSEDTILLAPQPFPPAEQALTFLEALTVCVFLPALQGRLWAPGQAVH